MIKAIVCCAKDYGIGKANGLLFDIPADMAHFKKETTGKICVFGYSTYLSLKYRPLKNRVNVVLWDKAPLPVETKDGAIFFNNFEALLNFVKIMSKEYDVYICGGASLYKLFMPYYDIIDLTMVNAVDSEATAFFPAPFESGFICSEADEPHMIEGPKGTNGYMIQKQIWIRQAHEEELAL